jgi:uncharacterized protein (DUF58 family)
MRGIPIDWGSLAPLRLRARAVAQGIYAGAHRSARKGPGIEFGGHRPYVPGDDLRFFDRRAMLRHDKLMVREFETETERALWICVDATASMAYRGPTAPASKAAYASLIAAALSRVALSSSDPVALQWIGGHGATNLLPMASREAFERVVGALESVEAAGDLAADPRAMDRLAAPIARRARRGSVIVLISDLLDLPDAAPDAFAALGSSGRGLVALQILDPTERTLDFRGTVRLRSIEGQAIVEADADAIREDYVTRLEAHLGTWQTALRARGGTVVRATTTDDPIETLRRVVRAIAEVRP